MNEQVTCTHTYIHRSEYKDREEEEEDHDRGIGGEQWWRLLGMKWLSTPVPTANKRGLYFSP